jgi:hypothetical protein
MPSSTAIFTIVVHPELIPDGDYGPLMELLADFAPELDEIGMLLSQKQQESFEASTDPWGEPWAPLAASTLREKARGGFPEQSLVRHGHLQAEVGETMLLTSDSVTTGIDLSSFPTPYPQYQDEGIPGRMPARVLVAITDEEIEQIHELLRQYIAQVTGQDLDGIEIREDAG